MEVKAANSEELVSNFYEFQNQKNFNFSNISYDFNINLFF
jgi:hypothetical protein